MSPEKQRIAIAEACPGWRVGRGWKYCVIVNCGNPALAGRLFDPLNDLNAMHEAEATLIGNREISYVCKLSNVIFGATAKPQTWEFAMLNATAAQRAEAFLRMIGKWEE